MLDIKIIRQNTDLVRKALKDKKSKFNLDEFLKIDEDRRKVLGEIENLKAKQNKIDEKVKVLLKEKKDFKFKIEESKSIKKEIVSYENEFQALDDKFKKESYKIPNMPHSSLPVGDVSNNKIIKEVGSKKEFSFKPLDHVSLAESLDIVDFKRAVKVSGSNFVLFKGAGAQLERALINFMLDLHTNEHNYLEIFPPKLVNRDSMFVTGQLPNLEDDMYAVKDDGLFLIPTAEVPVTNIHRNEIFNEDDLPRYYVAYTPCFRREAGSYGKETRGLTRVHEFDKVEMVKFVKPDDSYLELEKILSNACKVLDLLELPYRVVLLATGDISFAAAKCYDIELYSPGVDMWLEVSSCSNFEDFQARRGSIKYKNKKTGKNEYVHTLNGSGVALARLFISIIENYQQDDGSILIPEVLRRYLNGRERIKK
ncbi:MAG: serine--tRNA ligase [Candidatus Omnitrophica bacterium]|nr:serine--tRNA ligase [Candidatus Omnitrophota bacterium]